jgi:hypothetical protein
MVSLAVSTALTAFGNYLDAILPLGDAVEPLWQHLAVDVIVPNLDLLGILEATPV